MKKILALMLAITLCVGIASAQSKKPAKSFATVVFTTDIDCAHCAQKIYNTVPYEKGVKDLKVDVPTKRVTITYDEAKQTVESLQKAIEAVKVKVTKTEKQK